MDLQVREYVDKYLGQYKQRGNEIKVKVCPFCKADSRSNWFTFNINTVTGLFNCKRGKCGVSGNLTSLKKQVSPELLGDKEIKVLPLKKPAQLSQVNFDWIKARGISDQVIRDCRIAENEGAMFFPHFNSEGHLVTQKFTVPRSDGRRTEWLAGKTSFMSAWRVEKINPNEKVIITEGEFDAMAVMTAGYYNVISIPAGTSNMYWLGEDYDVLSKVKEFVLWLDFDGPGQKAKAKIANYLGYDRCKFIECEFKDANDALLAKGKNYILEQIRDAKQIHVENIVYMNEVQADPPWEEQEKLEIKIPALNNMLNGGLPMCGVTILSGYRGHGKTTLAYTFVLSAIEAGYKTFYYTGEISASYIRHQIEKTVAGLYGIEDNRANDFIKEQFGLKVANRLLINNSLQSYSDEDFIELIENCIRRYNCRVFVVDNLMKIKIRGCRSFSEQMEAQEDFVEKLDILSRKYGLQIILIQHPSKNGGRKLTDDDIRGNGRVMDYASNIIICHRLSEKFLKVNSDYGIHSNWDSMISVDKNRYGGFEGEVFTNFSRETNRFYTIKPEIEETWLECGVPF